MLRNIKTTAEAGYRALFSGSRSGGQTGGSLKAAGAGRRVFQPLEPRRVLDAGPLILSELMAVNDSTLADEDGDFSDWIEIHNPTAGVVDLDGWYLTDDPGDLLQWRFPSVSLGAGDYLVVFASGKNRADPAELHTNFKLSSDGEYLALVRSDAVTVSHQYAPGFPPQFADVSYGIGAVASTSDALVASGADAKFHLPTAGEDVLAWTAVGYDDSTWDDTFTADAAGMLITEISSGDVRFVEIQNASDGSIDTSGWSVLVNDASAQDVNQVTGVAWSLPASVGPAEVLYRTDQIGDNYWGSQIPWDAEGPGWAMIVDDAGGVKDFLAWGYTAAEIASLDVDYGGLTHITVGGQWSGAGAEPGTGDPGGGPGVPVLTAFNDHVAGAGTHPSATRFATNGTAAGPMKDVATGLDTGITLATSQNGVNYENTQGVPAAGTDAFDVFNGFVDFSSGSGSSLAISGADHYTHSFSGLDTGDAVTYRFTGTAVRGNDGYTNRWTLVTLQGADSATAAHSSGPGVVVVSPTQAAVWTGENHEPNQGFVAAWTEIDPGPDGQFSIVSNQYTGSTPGVGGGTANGSKGYAVAGVRLEELAPSGPLSWLKRTANVDGGTAEDFQRSTHSSKGQQNDELTVPFGTVTPVTTGIGFSDNQPAFQSNIATDVARQMHGVNASLWSRIEFQMGDPLQYNELTLRMKYDDGFAAYLNGNEVARRNAPDPLAFDSAATAAHPDQQAVVFEEIDVTDHLAGSLRAGGNVLAIHGLNAGAADADFLLLPELVASSVEQIEWYFFEATPGGPNSDGFIDYVVQPQVGVDHGFFESPFQVVISSEDPTASVRYTLDGSRPTATGGVEYTGPLTVEGTTTLRAAAFRQNHHPSPVVTRTYVFLDDVLLQSPGGAPPVGWPGGPVGGQVLDYGMDPDIVGNPVWASQMEASLRSIPTLSLVTDLDNLFDPATGIYVNSAQDGIEWERPASLELIHPDGGPGFQIDAGLRIRGGFSDQQTNPKHAFRLFFRDQYGAAKLEYPLFGDASSGEYGTGTFDKIDLRTGQAYAWSFDASGDHALVRDVFSRDTQREMEQPYTRSRYYHLYLGGQYWGIYQTQERSDAAYGESYLGGNRDEYDVVKVDVEAGYTIEATDGDLAAWQQLWNLADAGFDDAAYYRAQGLNADGTRNTAYPVLLDVGNLIDYMLVIFYTGDKDGPISALRGDNDPNNFFAVRNRNGEEGFRFFAHDAEHTLSKGAADRTGPFSTGDVFLKSNPQWLHQELMVHGEYRLRFADRAHEYLFNDGLLTADAASGRLTDRADEIQTAIIAESARWGDAKAAVPFDKNDWQAAIDDEVNTFFPARAETVVDQLEAATLYPAVAAPAYSQHGGQVDEGYILWISAPAGTIYYTLDGSDPRLPGGEPSPDALVYNVTPIVVGQSMVVQARARDGGQWSALNRATFFVGQPAAAGNLAVTELNYNPHDATPDELLVDPALDNDDFEFVELLNTGPIVIDLTGVQFTNGISFDFAAAGVTRLPAGEHVVVVKDAAAFQTRYGAAVNVAGVFAGSLDNNGERLRLADRFGDPIHDFSYNDSGGWPGRADGRGGTLEVLSTQGDYGHDDNWRGSGEYGGSPGTAGAGYVPDVVVNEVLSEPLPGGLDAIELYNTTAAVVDVGGWYLSNSSNDYRKFRIPPGAGSIVPAGGYLVFDEDDFNPSGGADPGDFSLAGSGGDELWLLEADDSDRLVRFADHAELGEALSGVSFGRSPNGSGPLVMMSQVTLGAENADPRVGAIVINELHTDPDVKTELVEYIELYNAGDRTEDLSGWYFSAGVDYTFPAGTQLAAGGYLLVSQDPGHVQAKFGVASLGPYLGKLENEGERVVLRDAAGIIQDEVDYGLGFPWPVVGDPPGYSLELINPAMDNNHPGSWRASAGSAANQETFVYANATWRYFKGIQEPSAQGAWRQIGFDDAGWPSGQTTIGYGEGFVRTVLADMRNGYSTVYLRREFEVGDPAAVAALLLELQYDDAVNVWINGSFLFGLNISNPEAPYNATADGGSENAQFVPNTLTNPGAYLVPGPNVLAVQLLNVSLGGSSDCFFDARLTSSSGGAGGVTPGAVNSVYAANAPPQMQKLDLWFPSWSLGTRNQPVSGEDVTVTVEITDPDGVAGATLDYQLVEPGDYIRISDARYEDPANWTTLSMYDDGTHGDAFAGDDVYTTVLPGALQAQRRLVRYRISAADALGASTTAPYPDDPQPNFAYFVYDGVPSWTGSARPGVEPQVTYTPEVLESVPVYQLITVRQDHLDAMYVPYRWGEADQQTPNRGSGYGGAQYQWEGTLVYDGVVYDHVRYRARGGVWRYSMGKNMFKFDFNKGHYFQAHDDYGRPYDVTWDKLNFSALIQQGNFRQRGEQGLFEWAGFKLHNLAGNAASNDNFLHFRIVEDAHEGGPDQFSTDFQGLYMTIEQPDGRLLDEHGLPDGNFYKMEGGTGTLNNQGPTQPTNKADLNAFMSGYRNNPTAAWAEANIDLEDYYSFRAISMAIHDYDMHAGKNYFYYHNPETGKWTVHNWDLDLCWTTTYGGGGGQGPLYDDNPYVHLLDIPELRIGYNNRVREIIDLLFNPEQTGMLLDECAQFVYTPGQPSMVDADAAMWDYNPILVSNYINSSKAGHGRYYEAVGTRDFAGMVQFEKNYVANRMGNIDPKVSSDDSQAPYTPTVTYVGEPGFPADRLEFQSSAFGSPGSSFAAMKWRIARVTDPGSPSFNPAQPRHYEITATWQSDEITTFDNRITIPGDDLMVGETYRVRVRFKGSDGRWSHWSAPVQLEAGIPVGPLVDGLRISELSYMPHPPTAEELAADPNLNNDDFEFVELYNASSQTMDLSGVSFTDGITYEFPAQDAVRLDPGEYLVLAKDPAAFALRYGTAVTPAGPYDQRFANGGEQVELTDPYGRIIQQFTYDNGGSWPGRAEGLGSTLEVVDVELDYSDSDNWRESTEFGGSPGGPGGGPLAHVLVNEVLSHSAATQKDAIELYSNSAAAVDIGGWYLSNSSGNYRKFRVPDGTVVSPGGYVVFDEDDFNPNPGNPSNFQLDGARQGDVWLLKADATGKLTHFVDHAEFGAAATGESWGRWPNGSGDFYPMLGPTLDKAHAEDGQNSGPRVGPLVISEVHYNPLPGADDNDLEFIEIYNPTGSAVDLSNWRVSGGIDYDFLPGTVLGACSELVVLPFAPTEAEKLAAFRDRYGIGQSVQVTGGYTGQLSDNGEGLRLMRPDEDPEGDPAFVVHLLEDEVIYDDQLPWPTEANGGGRSLVRLAVDVWGDAPVSWAAMTPSPGGTQFVPCAPGVVGRHVFYNASFFDGYDPAAGPTDDAAVATDKQALLPGQTATFSNYTSYTSGINGIMVDVEGLPEGAQIGADDFLFRAGNDANPDAWGSAQPPDGIGLRPGQGVDGSDRITLIWTDGAVAKQWLQVTVLATADTGLAKDDVFYFGNAIGESGNSTTDAKVGAIDMLGARDNQRNFLNPAPIDFVYDLNRDQKVNTIDMLVARNNQTHFLNALQLITVPPAAKDAVPPAAKDAVPPAAKDAVPPAAKDAVPGGKAQADAEPVRQAALQGAAQSTEAEEASTGGLDWVHQLEPQSGDAPAARRDGTHHRAVDELLVAWS